MAITTLAGIASGLQAVVPFVKPVNLGNSSGVGLVTFSSWTTAGFPAIGGQSGALNGSALTFPLGGALNWNDPPSGNAYLARFQASGYSTGFAQLTSYVMLCDRLWHGGGLDVTGVASPQAITFPGLPARDIAGSTNGDGVFLALEVGATPTAGAAPTVTATYTNSAGVGSRTATLIPPVAGVTGVSYFAPFNLQAGDTGVQSIQSISFSTSAWTSGAVNLVLYRPIALMDNELYGRSGSIDAVTGALPRIFNGSVLFFVIKTKAANAGINLNGEVQFTWG